MHSLQIIFAGSGEFGLASLRALRSQGHEVIQVISQPDRPAGRGGKYLPTPVARFAIDQALPLVRTADINGENLPPADLLVVIAFGQKIAPHIANHARLGSVNLHASRLPELRGAAPINWAILRGFKTTGNSVIRLAQKMDAGAILSRSEIVIAELETAGELHDRLAIDGATLLSRTVDSLVNQTAVETAQEESAATLAPKLNRDAARINWDQNGVEIARQIRGLHPWPGCRVRLIDEAKADRARLTLVRATEVIGQTGRAGTINSAGHVQSARATAVEILELQPDGKSVMSLNAYRNGHPWPAGWELQSI